MHYRWPYISSDYPCLSHMLAPCLVLSNLISIKPQAYQFLPIIGRKGGIAINDNFKSVFLHVRFYTQLRVSLNFVPYCLVTNDQWLKWWFISHALDVYRIIHMAVLFFVVLFIPVLLSTLFRITSAHGDNHTIASVVVKQPWMVDQTTRIH